MKLHSLQYLRAFAAMAVVWSHTVIQVESYKPYLRETGVFGVDIFFIISGFIMVYIARENDTPGSFIKNRVKRIVPLYWFFTLLMVAIFLLIPSLYKSAVVNAEAVVKSLLFIPYTSLSNPEYIAPILNPGWTLNYEMYFYALFAIALLMPPKTRIWCVTAIITVVFIFANVFSNSGSISTFYSSSIVFEFTLGMMLAVLFRKKVRVSTGFAWALLTVGAVLLFLQESSLPRIVQYGIPALMIVTGTLYIGIGNNRFFEMLGDSSYSLYLSHSFTLGACRAVLPGILGEGAMAAISFAVLSVVFCISGGIFVHYVIDTWLLRRIKVINFVHTLKQLTVSR